MLEMGGLDGLVFTAGIGENNDWLRADVCRGLEELGLVLDPAANAATRAKEADLSAPTSRAKVLVIPTNEELVVAREAHRLLLARKPN
jgi:acetate kinase